MWIRYISCTNFKSLAEFRLDVAKFTCLIGLNGAGKSTVLQLIDFISQQFRGDLKGWLDDRHWKAKELHSSFSTRKNIAFKTHLVSGTGVERATWYATFNPTRLRCSAESITTGHATLNVRDGQLQIVKRGLEGDSDEVIIDERIRFEYEGSILSQLKAEVLPESLIDLKAYFSGVRSLDLLSPNSLRQKTRESSGSIGLGGERLSAFVHDMSADNRVALTEQLKRVYPHLESLNSKSLRSGWKQLEIQEFYGERAIVTEARHINDGMLRLIAILAELQSDGRFLLFDEIENGINPELVDYLIKALTIADKQVMVTTHSPMILNYLSDDLAREGVIYLYKSEKGATRSIPFFSIPSLAQKLTVMGPGEAFADTNLIFLADEIEQTGVVH